MDYSIKLWLLFVLLSTFLHCIPISNGIELTFKLEAKAKDCFYQEIKKNTSVTMEYQVVFGRQYEITVTLHDPQQILIYRQGKAQFDVQNFKARITGVYRMCFNNDVSPTLAKLIYMGFQVGDEKPLPKLRDHLAVVTQLESSAMEIHKNLIAVIDHQTHHRLREMQGRKGAEELNHEILTWSLLETSVILISSITQVIVMKTFFAKKIHLLPLNRLKLKQLAKSLGRQLKMFMKYQSTVTISHKILSL